MRHPPFTRPELLQFLLQLFNGGVLVSDDAAQFVYNVYLIPSFCCVCVRCRRLDIKQDDVVQFTADGGPKFGRKTVCVLPLKVPIPVLYRLQATR